VIENKEFCDVENILPSPPSALKLFLQCIFMQNFSKLFFCFLFYAKFFKIIFILFFILCKIFQNYFYFISLY